MVILVVGTLGYVGYVVIGNIFGVNGTDALFFQSVGMAIGGFLLSMRHETNIKSTALNIIPGIVWGIGNLFMFYSQPKVGVATSFSLSQLLVIVSTLGGIFLLGEKRSTPNDWDLVRYCVDYHRSNYIRKLKIGILRRSYNVF